LKEILAYQVDEVAATLRMSPRTMERYVSRVLNFGEGKANNIRRLLNSVAMHSHVEFFIIEAVLEHPEKTLSEIAHYVYPRTGEFSVT